MSKMCAWKGLYLDRGLSYLRFKGNKLKMVKKMMKKKISNPTSIVKFQCEIEFGDNLRRVRDVTKMWAPLGLLHRDRGSIPSILVYHI